MAQDYSLRAAFVLPGERGTTEAAFVRAAFGLIEAWFGEARAFEVATVMVAPGCFHPIPNKSLATSNLMISEVPSTAFMALTSRQILSTGKSLQ